MQWDGAEDKVKVRRDRQIEDNFICCILMFPFPAYLVNVTVTWTISAVSTVTIVTAAGVGAISVCTKRVLVTEIRISLTLIHICRWERHFTFDIKEWDMPSEASTYFTLPTWCSYQKKRKFHLIFETELRKGRTCHLNICVHLSFEMIEEKGRRG